MHLLFVFASSEGHVASLQLFLEVLVDGKRHRLSRRNTHDARRDTLVKGVHAFLPADAHTLLVLCRLSGTMREDSTHLNISLEILAMRLHALVPNSAGVFCNLVLMVSIGALLNGPMAPLTRPITVVCQLGRFPPAYCGW